MIGNKEFDIDGVTRGFRFGTYTIKLIGDNTGVKDIGTIFKKISEGDIGMLLAFFHASAIHYCQHKKMEIDFQEVDVSDWMDNIGIETVNTYLRELLNQYTPKNSQPPETPGESQQSLQ